MRFFLKQELIWVPFIGIAWWALDFPFMKRYSREQLERNPALRGKDLETTRKACEKFRQRPVSIFNFLEGTRFTPEKHARQQSPYKHLLRPRAGGTAFVLGAMGGQLHRLLDVTIHYPQRSVTFWDLLCAHRSRTHSGSGERNRPQFCGPRLCFRRGLPQHLPGLDTKVMGTERSGFAGHGLR